MSLKNASLHWKKIKMINIEQRLQALEYAANTTDKSMKVFTCEGSEPTLDEQEKIDAMGVNKLMFVVFV